MNEGLQIYKFNDYTVYQQCKKLKNSIASVKKKEDRSRDKFSKQEEVCYFFGVQTAIKKPVYVN